MPVEWSTYDVTVEFEDRLVGGIPVVQEGTDRANAYESWARGQGVENDASFGQTLPEALAADPDMPVAVEEIEGLLTGFRSDQNGIYIEARQVKAMLREAAQRLGIIVRKRGSRQVVQHDMVVRGLDGTQKLRLYRGLDEEEAVLEPDGRDKRPISVVTRQGPRTAIKTFDYVQGAKLDFQVRILKGGVAHPEKGEALIGEKELADMLEFGGTLGIGADRSQGEGTFMVVKLERREAD